jgi:hypothetical protein
MVPNATQRIAFDAISTALEKVARLGTCSALAQAIRVIPYCEMLSCRGKLLRRFPVGLVTQERPATRGTLRELQCTDT